MKPPSEVLGVKIVGGLRETATPWAGASLLVERFRGSGLDRAAHKVLPVKGSAKGLKQGQTVESFVLLSALGGGCIEDMQRLRDDDGLAAILVSELAAGVFPSAQHGANAAWLRLRVITHNLLQMLKKVALPQEYSQAHPKRLRFAVFTIMGRLVSHAGQALLRIAGEGLEAIVAPSRKRIAALSFSPG